ncbi:MAG: hypothetical protein IV100_05275 [Myxococcales bacterium]|nr:hypothetical protein [Myxococcales bacterium]
MMMQTMPSPAPVQLATLIAGFPAWLATAKPTRLQWLLIAVAATLIPGGYVALASAFAMRRQRRAFRPSFAF